MTRVVNRNFLITKLIKYNWTQSNNWNLTSRINRMIIEIIKNFGKFDYLRLALESVQLVFNYIWWLIDCIWLLFLLLLKFFFDDSNNRPSFSQFCNVSIYNFKVWLVKFFIAIIQPRSQGVLPFLYFNQINFLEIKFLFLSRLRAIPALFHAL